VAKDGLFLAFALLALIRTPRWASLTIVVVVGHLALIVSNLLMWASGSVEGPAPVFGDEPPIGGDGVDVLLMWVGADVVVCVGLVAFLWLYQRARYRLDYLSPPAVRAVEAFADALFENVPSAIHPREVAERLDDYLAAFKGRAKGRIHAGLVLLYYLPILWRLAPFTALSRKRRKRWAQDRFDEERNRARGPLGGLRRTVRTVIRGTQQMAYVGYYSNPIAQESIGFEPFSKRQGSAEKIAGTDPDRPGLRVTEPWQISGREMDADAVVVGSGAAGAILAYRLAEAGRHVVVLERGPHVAPTQMTEDEMEMFARLYSDGALQLSSDFEFQATQGRCVGGSTTVNNAVCLEPSEPTKQEWARRVEGLRLDELERAFSDVRVFMHVNEQPRRLVTRAAEALVEGLRAGGHEAKPVHANTENCIGCGYCNSGCAYGAKLSMLDSVLLWGQQRFGDRLKVVSECEARKIVSRQGHARAVKCRLSDGRRLRVNARTVVVSAGAIASSRLLQRSRIGGRAAGRGLTFNIRTAVAARFSQDVRSAYGLQMTDYFRPHPKTPWMLESWAVPAMSTALAMPGWFDDHERYMADFPKIGWAGVLVGATTEGKVHRRPFLHGNTEFEFEPNDRDTRALKDAFTMAGEALFGGGAEEVMVSAHRTLAVKRDGKSPRQAAAELRKEVAEVIRDRGDVLNLGSSHPQGGNAMSTDAKHGVVDGDCRVHGFDNLFVCDASVFPTVVTVNPQLTVMALAEYAARRMLGKSGGPSGANGGSETASSSADTGAPTAG
jgi:choline dehydrogenase-like flavoprotein